MRAAKTYTEPDNTVYVTSDDDINPGIIAGIVIAGILAILAVVALVWMVKRERSGSPLFSPLVTDADVNKRSVAMT